MEGSWAPIAPPSALYQPPALRFTGAFAEPGATRSGGPDATANQRRPDGGFPQRGSLVVVLAGDTRTVHTRKKAQDWE